jgi:hypothetical protein
LKHYCRDLNLSNGSWMGLEKDLLRASNSDLSPKAIQHVKHLRVLGGEFIHDPHYDSALRKSQSTAPHQRNRLATDNISSIHW